MTQPREKVTLSNKGRFFGLAVIVVVMLVCGLAGLWLGSGLRPSAAAAPPATQPVAPAVVAVVLLVLGGAASVAGLGVYALVLATNCFTSDFSRPYFPAFRGKLWLANMLVMLLLPMAPAFAIGLLAVPLLQRAGLSFETAFPIALLAAFALFQLALIWVQIWAPLDRRMIVARLTALGFPPEQLRSGIPVGISNPAVNSFKKLTLVEDDAGMLWMTPELLCYRGDADYFDVRREQVLSIQQKADPGSMSSYGGAAHLILRFRLPSGLERAVRFHTTGGWTLASRARAMDRLADAVENGLPARAPPRPHLGSSVRTSHAR